MPTLELRGGWSGWGQVEVLVARADEDQNRAVENAERAAQVAAIFDRVADTYDRVGVPWFTPIAKHLVDLAAPRPGERVLDIGCGRGAALFPLAEAVGPTGHVTGIDLSAGMIEATRTDVTDRGLTNVDLQLADASAPDLAVGDYDLVVASLVVFFMPDPLAALTAWRTLLAPTGRLAITTFGPRDPRWEAIDATFRPYLPPQLIDARTAGATGPFASDEAVEALVGAAGFIDVRTSSFDVDTVLTDAEHWYTFSRSHGQRVMWDNVPEADVWKVRAAAAPHLEAARGEDGRIHLAQQVRCTLASHGAQ